MAEITHDTDLLTLKTMKEGLVERYTNAAGQTPVIEYRAGKSSEGKDGYFLSIKSYSGQLNPVPSQELIRVLRQGFKAMGFDILKLGLERKDEGEGKAVFISHELLQTVFTTVAFMGSSQSLQSFKSAIVGAAESPAKGR